MKQLSIIIVNYNVRYFLALCLDSVCDAIQDLEAEIIVVDNASSDESCEMVKARYPEVILVENTDNVGFAAANNQGVSIAQGEYVCILNPDTVVGERVFDTVYGFAKANPKKGAIGVRLVDGTGKFLPECKRNLPTPKVAFNKLFGSGDTYYARDVEPSMRGAVHVLVGAFMFIKTEVYLEAGGFDEQYFMYGEDIDLSHTIAEMGYENYYMGDQVVIHFKGESTSKNTIYHKRFYNAMSIFYNKHLKSNVLEGAMVNAGLWYARKFHRKQNFSKSEAQPAAEKYSLVSKNIALKKTIEKIIKKEVTQQEVFTVIAKNTEVLFDMDIVSYRDCLKQILDNQDKGVTYKFIPKNSTFAIGSNSSEGRGMLFNW